MKNAIGWFEIPTICLNKAQAFYEAVLNCKLRREPMGPSECAVSPSEGEGEGIGGALVAGPTAPVPGAGRTLRYLNASPSLSAALADKMPAEFLRRASKPPLPV